jgi:HK97 family phage prohead protease
MTTQIEDLPIAGEDVSSDVDAEPIYFDGTEIKIGSAGKIVPDALRSAVPLIDQIDDLELRAKTEQSAERLFARLEAELGAEIPDPFGRSSVREPALRSFETVTLAEFQIRSDGDGRTVDAYAVPFDQPAEVVDAEGHYWEVFRKGAFARQLARGIAGITVLYNHGLDLFRRPSERFSVPIGRPVEIREDGNGVFTSTRYAATPLGDEILQLVREGAITGQSIQFVRTPRGRGSRRTKNGHDSGLDLVERYDVRMVEYGPTPVPVYSGASVVGVRASQIAEHLSKFSDTEREELVKLLRAGSGDPVSPDPTPADSDSAALDEIRHDLMVRRHSLNEKG